MEKTLQMSFANSSGKSTGINLSGIKDAVTSDEVKAVMQMIIDKNIFTTTGGDLKTILSANLVSRDVESVSVK